MPIDYFGLKVALAAMTNVNNYEKLHFVLRFACFRNFLYVL